MQQIYLFIGQEMKKNFGNIMKTVLAFKAVDICVFFSEDIVKDCFNFLDSITA